MGLFLIGGPLADDSAAKLKRSQLSVCTVYVYGALCTLFPPAAEICARLAGNYCQYNSKVWGKWYGLADYLLFHS